MGSTKIIKSIIYNFFIFIIFCRLPCEMSLLSLRGYSDQRGGIYFKISTLNFRFSILYSLFRPPCDYLSILIINQILNCLPSRCASVDSQTEGFLHLYLAFFKLLDIFVQLPRFQFPFSS
jgi:hypothetical protein